MNRAKHRILDRPGDRWVGPGGDPSLRASGRRRFVAFLLFALVIGFPYFEATRNANERPRLLQGMALVEQRSFAIDEVARVHELETGPDIARTSAGRIYPNKPPGSGLVAAAAYLASRAYAAVVEQPLTLRVYTWWARFFGGILPTVMLVSVLLARYESRFGAWPTRFAAAVYVFGTPAAAYAHLFYGHQLSAALVFAALILALFERRESVSRDVTLAGGLAGAAVLVDYAAAFAIVPLVIVMLWRTQASGRLYVLGLFVLGALPSIALLAAYQTVVFGSPWTTGYHAAAVAEFSEKHAQGLMGLGIPTLAKLARDWIDPAGGLLWFAPIVVVALWGLVRDYDFDDARVQLGIAVMCIAVSAGLSFEGGWRVGPRYLVLALPVVVLGVASVVARITSASGLVVIGALATYGVVVNTLAANLWPHFDLSHIHQPFAEVLLPLWRRGFEPHGLRVPEPFGLGVVALALSVAFVGTWYTLGRSCRLAVVPRSLVLAGAIFVGGAATSITLLVPPHPDAARNLAYVESVWEPKPASAPSVVLVPGP